MIYLDTHIVVWLYAGLVEKFGTGVQNLLNEEALIISPIVRLELQYLYEIKRVRVDADAIVNDLNGRIGLQICDKPFDTVITQALSYKWTRDPYDRLIVANAALTENVLISKDTRILDNYPRARWQ